MVFQFAISLFLITSTLVVYRQIKYIQSRDIGYNRDHVLIVHNTETLGSQSTTFKEEIKQLAGVDNATLTSALPTSGYGNYTALFEDRALDQKRAVHSQRWSVDEDYLNTLGIRLKSGRNFSRQMPTDSNAVIINEAAAKQLTYANPLNQQLYAPADNLLKKINTYHIIGVIRDFNFQSLRENVTPLMLQLQQDPGALSVRIRAGADVPAILAQVRDKWKGLSPNRGFAYSFMQEDFDGLYRSEQRIGQIFLAFSTLAILIACLGLFGLVAYAAEQRTREIGIRKVLGAQISTIVSMLSRDFIRLVVLSDPYCQPIGMAGHAQMAPGLCLPDRHLFMDIYYGRADCIADCCCDCIYSDHQGRHGESGEEFKDRLKIFRPGSKGIGEFWGSYFVNRKFSPPRA